jgi:lambda family phage tail tape measure protein
LQDLQGALLATSQVFGKGKVSAEELRRQIGDRLPGAFNLFAEAIGTTTPELDKMLAQGKVNLNDFMTFTEALIKRFGTTAEEIAASSQAAGDRLATVMARLRENVGRELQPLGAQFQEIAVSILTENEKVFTDLAKGLADAIVSIGEFISKNQEAIKALAVFALSLGTATLAVKAFAAITASVKLAGLISAIISMVSALKALSLAAVAAKLKIIALNAVLMINPWFALATGITAAAVALGTYERANDRVIASLKKGGAEEINAAKSRIVSLEADIQKAEERLQTRTGRNAAATRKEITRLRADQQALRKAIAETEQAAGARDPAQPFSFPSADDAAGAGAGADKAGRASQVPQLMIALELQKQLSGIQDRIRDAQDAGNNLLQIRLRGEEQLLQIRSQISLAQIEEIPQEETALKIAALRLRLEQTRAQTEFELNQAFKQNIENATKAIDELNVGYMNQVRQQRRVKEFMENGINPQLAEQLYLIERAVEISGQELTKKLISLQQEQELTQDLQTKLDYQERILEIEERLAQLRGDSVSAIEAARELYDPPDPTNFERVKEAIRETREALDQLVDPVNQLISAASAIGDAFADSFKGLITGSMSAKEALRNFFSSLADYFVDMAAKMIAQWIKLALLNQILALFPGGAAAGAGAGAGAGSAISKGLSAISGFAEGGAFSQNGIQPFAKGGVVNRPTMFKFANGGAMQTGVMGEAGPEAIMPLKRGADGKLGVAARMDGAMSRYRNSSSAATAVDGVAAADGGAEGAGVAAIDVRYSVERINDVEYVTADQFREGMRQAARQGAMMGRNNVYSDFTNKRSVRQRMGL